MTGKGHREHRRIFFEISHSEYSNIQLALFIYRHQLDWRGPKQLEEELEGLVEELEVMVDQEVPQGAETEFFEISHSKYSTRLSSYRRLHSRSLW